ncbi:MULTISPECIES: hypothetical protein [Streptomyces]|uniref:Uncharacterized protein n=1 Tax=Streptomyces morookaense TaxID=1970 RepID=A0A7Y7E5Q9_STRMO|nr:MULTISPECIES: hypothetical protein [Streptomyces]MCC2277743.1 hypothetical protein [Streptomyces sp. ET3-23]NVK77070.1 hypothetical protein [Streptomyces morookaense]GHF23764.1 hypothetical protein GCM10010359_27450 [Streptomyces morookaense]
MTALTTAAAADIRAGSRSGHANNSPLVAAKHNAQATIHRQRTQSKTTAMGWGYSGGRPVRRASISSLHAAL